MFTQPRCPAVLLFSAESINNKFLVPEIVRDATMKIYVPLLNHQLAIAALKRFRQHKDTKESVEPDWYIAKLKRDPFKRNLFGVHKKQQKLLRNNNTYVPKGSSGYE